MKENCCNKCRFLIMLNGFKGEAPINFTYIDCNRYPGIFEKITDEKVKRLNFKILQVFKCSMFEPALILKCHKCSKEYTAPLSYRKIPGIKSEDYCYECSREIQATSRMAKEINKANKEIQRLSDEAKEKREALGKDENIVSDGVKSQ